MIATLDRKLLRDLTHMKGQFLAIALVMACGVGTFVMMRSAMHTLSGAKDEYYRHARFAHIFAPLKRAPNTLAARLAEIPGVSDVHTRVVREVTLDLETLNEPAIGRILSIPNEPESTINDVILREGRWPAANRDDEVLVNEGFMKAHQLRPGAEITALLNGRLKRLRVAGVALSPEFTYQIRPGQLIPDNVRFGVFWMRRQTAEAVFDMTGGFNDAVLTLTPDANEAEVISRVDDLLRPYGGLGAYGRADQVSNRFISDEIAQLQRMGLIVPGVFLFVAAFLLNVVLSRIVSLQRDQIAALKAFGYSNGEVAVHYLKLVLLIASGGTLLGVGIGAYLGTAIVGIYRVFYQFPRLEYRLPGEVVVLAFGVSSLAAAAGTLNVIRSVARLPPAEAMRPEPPSRYGPALFERIGLAGWLSQPMRMVLRHIERRPAKSASSILGMALAVAILIMGRFSRDSLDFLLDVQFTHVERQDLTVTFVENATASSVHDVARFDGALQVEPFRAVPARLRFGHRVRRVAVLGTVPEPRLTALIDDRRRPIELPPTGLVMNEKLARVLGVEPGDELTMEVLDGSRPVRQVKLARLSTEYLGMSVYMALPALNDLLREGEAISGVRVQADPDRLDALYHLLKQTPRVASVANKRSSIHSFRETVIKNMLQMQWFNLMFACVIAFGVVYNTARVALSERGRELASLRVLGFTRGEISFILLGELAVLTLIALPVGLVLGYGMARFAVMFLDTELYRIPLVISAHTNAFSASVVLLASIVSGLIVRRRLDHLDLIAVLKTRE